jgi:heptosyltransferase I
VTATALVVRLSAVGDVVHTLPVLDALRDAGWTVAWLVEPLAAPLLEDTPGLRVVRATPAKGFTLEGVNAALDGLRALQADVALDLQGLWKSAAWACGSGAPRRIGYGRQGRREPSSALLLKTRVAPAADAVHVIDHNLALLRALGIEAVGRRTFPLPRWPEAVQAVDRALEQRGAADAGLALVNPAGGWASKLWTPEGFGAVARAARDRGLRALVTWGPGEEALADRVVAASGGAAERCFPTTLREYVELARRARVVVASDTGPLHLAGAVGTPVVGVFGPTDPARNGPWSAQDVVVRRTPPCAPCHKRACPVHDGIMATIPAADVIAALDRRLERAA